MPNPWQTRYGEPDPGFIKSLALDIAANGLIQTPVGRLVNSVGAAITDYLPHNLVDYLRDGDSSVQLAVGHNRLSAFRWLNDVHDYSRLQGDWSTIPIDIQPYDNEQMAIKPWSENEKRRDHTPFERALAIQKRIEDFGWTQELAAEKLNVSRPVVSNSLRLLKLPHYVQDSLQNGEISERQAHALLPLYEVPDDIAGDSGFEYSIQVIVGMARQGTSSDLLRQRVSEAVAALERQVQPALVTQGESRPAPIPPEPIAPVPSPVPAPSMPAYAPQPPASFQERAAAPADISEPTSEIAEPALESGITPTPTPAPEPAKPKTWPESEITATISWTAMNGSGRTAIIGLRANNGAPLYKMLNSLPGINLTDVHDALGGLIGDLRSQFDQNGQNTSDGDEK
jgi:ParB/RepB/Spo0J family partition protein